MKKILVRDWMTANPVTISAKAKLPQARQLMAEKRIRRLLVMDDNRLVGIITRGDIREAQPSDAPSLSLYELNFQTTNIAVEKIMTRKVVTIAPDAPVTEAARLMLEHKVGGLPVCDGNRLVGIITDSDLFRMIIHELNPLMELA